MALPKITDLVMYVNKALTGNDWNTNWQKIVNWLTSGETDVKVKSIEVSNDGGIVNNGSLTQSGNLTVDGTMAVSSNLTVGGTIEGDGSKLYNLITQGVQAFTPFTINSGNVDSNGDADLMSATPTTSGGNITKYTINFKIGDTYPSVKATTAEGNTFELESLTDEDLASNNTFYYFIGSEQTAPIRLTNITVYIQKSAPSGSANDIWLDTYVEPLICYKLSDAGIWEKFDYVPLGKVVITNIGTASATATVTTFPYNDNNYNIVSHNDIAPDYTNGETKSVSTSYTATENGYIYARGSITNVGGSVYVTINDVKFDLCSEVSDSGALFMPISVGDTYGIFNTTGGLPGALKFYPYKKI